MKRTSSGMAMNYPRMWKVRSKPRTGRWMAFFVFWIVVLYAFAYHCGPDMCGVRQHAPIEFLRLR